MTFTFVQNYYCEEDEIMLMIPRQTRIEGICFCFRPLRKTKGCIHDVQFQFVYAVLLQGSVCNGWSSLYCPKKNKKNDLLLLMPAS